MAEYNTRTFEAGRREERLYFLKRLLSIWEAEAGQVVIGEIQSVLVNLGCSRSDVTEPVIALARMVIEREEAFQMIEKISGALGNRGFIDRSQSLSTSLDEDIMQRLPEPEWGD